MRHWLLAFALVFPACAPKGPPPQFLAEIAKAEALLRDGCYTCLEESLALFEKHASAKIPLAGAKEGAFNAALLIAIREKELGIPGDESMQRARQLASKALAERAQSAVVQREVGSSDHGPVVVQLDFN